MEGTGCLPGPSISYPLPFAHAAAAVADCLQLLSLLRREHGFDVLTRLLLNRRDLSLLVFTQTECAKRAIRSTESSRPTGPAGTTSTRTSKATLTTAARAASLHVTLRRPLAFFASRGPAVELVLVP